MNIDLLKENADVIYQLKSPDMFAFTEKLTKNIAEEVEKLIKAGNKPVELLTRQQVVEIIGVNKSTLWRWQKKGILISIKIGGKGRYRKSDMEKILIKSK